MSFRLESPSLGEADLLAVVLQDRPSIGPRCIREGVTVLQDQDSLHSCGPRDSQGQPRPGEARRQFSLLALSLLPLTIAPSQINPNTIMLVGSAPNFPDGELVRLFRRSTPKADLLPLSQALSTTSPPSESWP